MTPATHAAIAAVVAGRTRSLWAALPASFLLHFVADALYHFEAFYPLSVAGKWSQNATMVGLTAALAALGAPAAIWIARRDHHVGWLALYGLLLSLGELDPEPARRAAWAVAVAGSWWVVERERRMRRWVLCGFAAYLPDLLKLASPWMQRLHRAAHYDPSLDLGDWVSLLVNGRWRLDVNARIFDPCYQAGYALEIALEGAILFACLYSVTNLAAVDHQRRAVDKGSLVRK